MGHWFIDTAGVGSIIVFGVGLSVLAAYTLMLRWIQTAPPDHPRPAEPVGDAVPQPQAAGGGK